MQSGGQRGKERLPTKRQRTSESPSSIIDNSACSEVTTDPSPYDANPVAATRPRGVRQSSRIGKAGEAWDGIGLEGELAFSMHGGGLKHWRSSKDTQMLGHRGEKRVESGRRSRGVELASCQRQESRKQSIHNRIQVDSAMAFTGASHTVLHNAYFRNRCRIFVTSDGYSSTY